jgi:hypothetical protein
MIVLLVHTIPSAADSFSTDHLGPAEGYIQATYGLEAELGFYLQ